MNKKQATQIITLLANSYENVGQKDISQKVAMVNTWYECLKDLEYEEVLTATYDIIKTSKYAPTVSEIRKTVEQNKKMLEPKQEWKEIDIENLTAEEYDMFVKNKITTKELIERGKIYVR